VASTPPAGAAHVRTVQPPAPACAKRRHVRLPALSASLARAGAICGHRGLADRCVPHAAPGHQHHPPAHELPRAPAARPTTLPKPCMANPAWHGCGCARRRLKVPGGARAGRVKPAAGHGCSAAACDTAQALHHPSPTAFQRVSQASGSAPCDVRAPAPRRAPRGGGQALFASAPQSFTGMCTPSSLASVAASVVQPGDVVPAGASFPIQVRPSLAKSSTVSSIRCVPHLCSLETITCVEVHGRVIHHKFK